MGNIILNNWNGGISTYYHTGQANQCADIKNINITTHPDAIMLANTTTKIAETTGNIMAGVNMGEYTKNINAELVWVTDIGEIWYKNEKIHTENERKYKQIFFSDYTENKVKKVGIFVLHETGIDRMEYDKNENIFKNYIKNIDGFKIKAENVEKIPLLKWNNNILLGIGNQIVMWDGIILENKIKLSELTKIVGMTAYGDYVHIYATDTETSYKAIYDPINDDQQPGSLRNYGRMEWVSAIENESVDIVITDNDEIYQSSGLQIQKYLNSEKNIFREDKNFNPIIAGYNEKIYIGGEKYLYELLPGEMGTSPKLVKYDVGGEIKYLYGTKNALYIGYKKDDQNILATMSEKSGENVVDTGEYTTLWQRVAKYANLTGVNVEMNVEGKSGGSAEIWVRTNMEMDWIKVAECNKGKWIDETDKSRTTGKLKNWHEIQAKIILKKSSDGKSPILYTLNLEYEHTNNG